MFFNSLSKGLSRAFDSIKGRAVLTSKDFDNATEGMLLALIDADVALDVAKSFIASVKEKVVGQKIVKKFSPSNAIMKIVKEEMIKLLGEKYEGLVMHAKSPTVIMMVGLQGAGKTTTSTKLAVNLVKKYKKKPLLASLDVYRPAAQKQLALLGEQSNIHTLEIIDGQQPKEIADRALKSAKSHDYDVLILDTAGRLHIDSVMMIELEEIKRITNPSEILIVVDSITGQDAINIVSSFHTRLALTGVVLTRIDGDSKGGVALSIRSLTNCPIKFFGYGEKVSDFEEFYPERIANRIMGMGDIDALMERASQEVVEDEVDSLKQKMDKGHFDFNDLRWQFKTIDKLGGITKLLNFIPGMSNAIPGGNKSIDGGIFRRNISIINSMTPLERKNPQIINASRKSRIAKGAGVRVVDVNVLMKQFTQAKTLFLSMSKGGLKNIKPDVLMNFFGKGK